MLGSCYNSQMEKYTTYCFKKNPGKPRSISPPFVMFIQDHLRVGNIDAVVGIGDRCIFMARHPYDNGYLVVKKDK